MEAFVVPKDKIDMLWNTVEPMLAMATEHSSDRYSTIKIFNDLMEDKKLLWILVDENDTIKVALTTSVEDYPGVRALRVGFAGGEDFLNNLEPMRKAIKEFGASVGCTKLEVLGRKGWERVLTPMGFKFSYLCMEEDI